MRKIWLIIVFIMATGVCFSEETQPMNQNELKSRDEDGTISILKRKNYKFFSLIHQPLCSDPQILTSDFIILWFDYGDDFANMLAVSLEKNSAEKSLMEYALGEVEKENKRTDSLAAEWDLNTLSEIPLEELEMSNASVGYLIYGSNTRRKPMKIRTVFGFLQNKDGSNFLKLFGIVSVNPGHPVYDDPQELERYLYDLKVDILTTRFESI